MRVRGTYIIIGILIVSLFILNKCKNTDIEKLKTDAHKTLLKSDKLRLEKKGIYKKYVTDSLTKKELKDKVRDLQIKVKNPIIVEKIVFVPKYVKKQADTVYIKGDTVKIVDYYPKKQDAFLRYTFLKVKDSSESEFKFLKKIKLDLVINQLESGVMEANIKSNDFVKIDKVSVNMLPKEKKEKTKSLGFLLGAGFENNNNSKGLILNTGLRYKKTYLQVQATTNQSIGVSLTKEF